MGEEKSRRNGTVRVGVFDSGIGGLTVLKACVGKLPDCLFYYYGDNARAPYGSRPCGEIVRFVSEALRRFERIGVDAAVLACNTATAVCAEQMRAAFPFPVVGVEPAVRPAALQCSRVLVLATPRTAESDRLRRLLTRYPQCEFTVCALPHLAGAIERALTLGETLTISDHLPAGRYDGVVLGCTHYVFFRQEIARFYGCRVFDGGEGTANRLKSLFAEQFGRKENGIDDHSQPEQNPNICFTKKCKEKENRGVIFLGNGGKVNESVYFTNICFNSI